MDKGQWHIYTGNGKGKTTACIGMAARALGCGKKVCMIQFLKRGGTSEIKCLNKLGLSVDCGYPPELPPWNQKGREEWRKHSDIQLEKAKAAASGDFDVLILDELVTAVSSGFIDEADAIALASGRKPEMELITSGRGATQNMIDAADLVTEMMMVKHYMEKGLQAREGIEF